MKMLVEYLKDRLKLADCQLVTYDELAEWPAAQVEKAKEDGYLRQVNDADGVICRECPEHCWKEIETREKDGRSVGTFFCEDEDCGGLMTVGLEQLQQWEIVTLKPKKRKAKRKLKTPKAKAMTTFKRWDKDGRACFIHDGGKIKFYYRDVVREIPLQKGAQAIRVLAAFLTGVQTSKEIKQLAAAQSAPSQIVRNINRAINNNLMKAGFTDVQGMAFIWYNQETFNYELTPKITDVDTFNRVHSIAK